MEQRSYEENAHRFALMLKDWSSRQGKTRIDEITWHDIFLATGLAHFDLVPNRMNMVIAPGPDSWDPSEVASDEELLREMLSGQAEAEESFIDDFTSGLQDGFERRGIASALNRPRMMDTVEYLTSTQLAGRAPGTHGGRMARDFIRDAFDEIGLTPAGTDGFDQPIPGNDGANLIGVLPGADVRSDRYILLAAHYDHLGRDGDDVYPGANDNAAAVAVLLEVARILSRSDEDLDRSVLVCAFDAEEPPYFLTEEMGSIYFVEHPTVSLEKIDVMICMDLVGAPLGSEALPAEVRDSIFVLGSEFAEGLGSIVDETTARLSGITPRRIDNYIVPPLSDYYAFQQAGIPHLFFTGGRNAHYHQPSDTAEKLDYERMISLTTYLVGLINSLSHEAGSFAYVPGGTDDLATVRSLTSIARLISDEVPDANDALLLLGDMQVKLDGGSPLNSQDRATIQMLASQLEQVVA